jgi:hypothetical protein
VEIKNEAMVRIAIDKPSQTVILNIEDFDMQNVATQDFAVAILSEKTTVIMPSSLKGSPNFYIGALASGVMLLPPVGGTFYSKGYEDGIEFDNCPFLSVSLKYVGGSDYIVVGTSS